MQISQATTPDQISAMRGLLEEYAAWLDVDLCFQGFAQELATLPGAYAPPRGRLFLATTTEGPAGCVALRPIGDAACEMKRLFVRPSYRRQGLGRTLAECLIVEAQQIGYSTMRLDTLAFMHDSIRLYEAVGFVRRSAYYDTPLQGKVFMERKL